MQTQNQADARVSTKVDAVEMLASRASLKHPATATTQSGGRVALSLAGRTLWHLPGRFGIARLLAPSVSLRCVIFHDISDTESSLTRGLGVTVTRSSFEAALTFLTRHYTPVSLQQVLENSDGNGLPPRPVLVTFDDAYASVVDVAAPLCRKFGVPAVFFVNAAFIDNHRIALDNLVCHVANSFGLGAVNDVVRAIDGTRPFDLRSLTEVFNLFLPPISLQARQDFRDALLRRAQISEQDLAGEARLYLTRQRLRDLSSLNFEIGNHTYTHVNCRSLSGSDFEVEISRNRAVLEEISGTPVRSFSVPYGSSSDLTENLAAYLKLTGHEAIFLAESLANPQHGDLSQLNRVSLKADDDAEFFSEIEILPRLRMIRNRLVDVAKLRWKVSHSRGVN
jgi:peptidoglycan/xylan/chitin deacetylase (PgdA/CDA1 family)